MDSNFAFANTTYRSYPSCHVHEPPQRHAELSLQLLRVHVFWCAEAEPLAIAFSLNELQPTAGTPGRWVFCLWGMVSATARPDGAVAKW
jgi:hypothetical protein